MTAHPRLPDWQPRLGAYLGQLQGRPFRYGRLDCMLFTVGAVVAMTGHDYGRGLRGYRSRAEGLRKIKPLGFSSHVELAASWWPEISPSEARPGDVLELEGLSMGICQGPMAYAVGTQGLTVVPRSLSLRAFRI
ncbi:DUF6950 family protein [Limimaricola pyoseonensis]|uniref:DUF6950 domain-containing protein n=1 Tax=Limimaricola pyoseonensis TaxID=521013 RepID=A0A1G7GPS6_9RHOB|nr:hypothetical protein [Limimaricola pyoseonensis]SDE89989.1 hypothetical protein SAMN04488567_2868 [Limimaricola pyoseonensis]